MTESVSLSAEEKRHAHLRGVKVTAASSLFGVAAAVVSWAVTSGALASLDQRVGVAVLALAVALQRPLMPKLGKHEMTKKDWLYVGFMTFDLWFVSWTILLTAKFAEVA
ncbi:MAG: hypothetical protein ACOCT0_05710 [Halobacteriota archaeon]